MDFNQLKEIVGKYIDLSKAIVNDSRECIKDFEITDECKNQIKNVIPEPWYLGKCADTDKPAIYNKVAETIDNIVTIGDIFTIEDRNILINNKDMVYELINKRKNIGATDSIFRRIYEILDSGK